MEDFELLRHVTIGQYMPTGSFIHNLDVRVKLLGSLVLVVALAASNSLASLLLGTVALLALTALALVPLSYVVRGLRAVWPFMLILAVLQLLAFPGLPGSGCDTLWQWRFLSITTCSLHLALASLLRFVSLFLLISLVTLTTSITEVTHGVEHLLRPLARLGLPAHELALVLTLALRFVPLLAEESERLMKAQAARGADFGRGRSGFIQRVRRMFPLLIPLFVTSLDRAEDLALAMEARCYRGSKDRTHLIQLESHLKDYLALGVMLALSVLLITIPLP